MRRSIILAAAAFAALPATALAQDPVPPATPAPPAPAEAGLTIKLKGVPKTRQILAGTKFRVNGTVTPFVAGQQAVIRIYRGHKKIHVKRVKVNPGPNGTGIFSHGFSSTKSGAYTVKAVKESSDAQKRAKAADKHLTILTTDLHDGSRGPAVRLLQKELRKRGYVTGKRGLYDARTARAVVAFRKMTGLPRIYTVNRAVFSKLGKGAGYWHVRYPNHGRHVEASINKQALALINGKKVERIYPTSSGAPATPTILGHFRFYMKGPGFNAKGMYFSNYFIRGYAIHGYHDVPTYNASHGCLRVPNPDAYSIYKWIRIGDRIDVYR